MTRCLNPLVQPYQLVYYLPMDNSLCSIYRKLLFHVFYIPPLHSVVYIARFVQYEPYVVSLMKINKKGQHQARRESHFLGVWSTLKLRLRQSCLF